MANGNGGPSGDNPGGKRRRPKPPTIDLTAAEVASEAGAASASPEIATPPPDLAQAQPDSAEPSARAEVPPPAASEPAASTEPPQPPEVMPPAEEPRAWPPPWTGAAAGAAAAALVLLGVVFGLWKVGWIGPRDERPAATAARVGELDAQLQRLAARPAAAPAPAADDRIATLAQRAAAGEQALAQVTALEQRLGKAEASLNAPVPAAGEQALAETKALNERLGKAEAAINAPRAAPDTQLSAQVKRLEERLGKAEAALPAADAATAQQALDRIKGLEGRLDNTDAAIAALRPSDVQLALQRVAEVDAETKSVAAGLADLRRRLEEVAAAAAAVAARDATPPVDRVARLAAAATALRGAVERGEPFAAELAAVRPLVADQAPLAPLEPFAATGVSSAAALAGELSALAANLRRASAEPANSGVLDRLQAGATKLVRVRPADQAAPPDSADALARIERQAAAGDLAGAQAELAKLPEPTRAALGGWANKAATRTAAVAAARGLAGDAIAALAQTAQQAPRP